jgi:hypothetical protein
MPLAAGKKWTYHAHYGIQDQRVESVLATREVAVGDGDGFELSGPMGTSRLGWNGHTLVADEAANAFFSPSIPLLTDDGRPPAPWAGQIRVNGHTYDAKSDLVQSPKPVKMTVSGQNFSTRAAKLTVYLLPNRGKIVLDSWFQPGVGLVQQEQRTNDDLVVQIQLVTAAD